MKESIEIDNFNIVDYGRVIQNTLLKIKGVKGVITNPIFGTVDVDFEGDIIRTLVIQLPIHQKTLSGLTRT
ncbi:MAG: hypothetical protein HOK72_11840 [Flavobacteriales bacterium]|nr:hypothetical protein [Flavobacteriales bacterium]